MRGRPLVAGHEIVGNVVAVGDGERRFRDKLTATAIGVQRSSCGTCYHCEDGAAENVCPSITKTLAGPGKNKGGFKVASATRARGRSGRPRQFLGDGGRPVDVRRATTFSPLKRHAKAGDRVGVVGIGGLGHIALQFGKAMGCEMVALIARRPRRRTTRRNSARRPS